MELLVGCSRIAPSDSGNSLVLCGKEEIEEGKEELQNQITK